MPGKNDIYYNLCRLYERFSVLKSLFKKRALHKNDLSLSGSHGPGHFRLACRCYKPYESLMSRKNLLMYSLLENCVAAASLQSTATKRELSSPRPSAVFGLYGHKKNHSMTGQTAQNHSALYQVFCFVFFWSQPLLLSGL